MKKIKYTYHLGNILRGFVVGDYSSDEQAWKSLCKKFDDVFPSQNGRVVYMYKEVPVKLQATPGQNKKLHT